jgi:hypothetical protein
MELWMWRTVLSIADSRYGWYPLCGSVLEADDSSLTTRMLWIVAWGLGFDQFLWLDKISYEHISWIHLAQVNAQLRAVLSTVTNLQIPWKHGTSWVIIDFCRKFLQPTMEIVSQLVTWLRIYACTITVSGATLSLFVHRSYFYSTTCFGLTPSSGTLSLG